MPIPKHATRERLAGLTGCLLLALADVPLALVNVCFEGKNGNDASVTRCLLYDPWRTYLGASSTRYFRPGNPTLKYHRLITTQEASPI